MVSPASLGDAPPRRSAFVSGETLRPCLPWSFCFGPLGTSFPVVLLLKAFPLGGLPTPGPLKSQEPDSGSVVKPFAPLPPPRRFRSVETGLPVLKSLHTVHRLPWAIPPFNKRPGPQEELTFHRVGRQGVPRRGALPHAGSGFVEAAVVKGRQGKRRNEPLRGSRDRKRETDA